MKAIILAGGEGTRLRPLTLSLPKPVVPVVDRPFLRHQLDLLARAGVKQMILALAYRPERIQTVFGDGSGLGLRIQYAVEETPLGTGGAVKNVERDLDSTTVVLNGDVLTDVDLAQVVSLHRARGASATLVVTPVPNPSVYGLVETDAEGRVLRFVEKPTAAQITTNMINAGIYVIETETFRLMPPGVALSIERSFFPELLATGHNVQAFVHRGYWIDIGTPEKYLQVHRDVLRGRFPVTLAGRPSCGGWVHEAAQVDPAARLDGPFYVGPNCQVASGARVGPDSVLVADAHLASGSAVVDSVVWNGCRVGPESEVQGAILGPGVRTGRKVSVAPGSVLGEGSVLTDFSRSGRIA